MGTSWAVGPPLLGYALTITGPSGRELKIRWSTLALWLVFTVFPARAFTLAQEKAEANDD
jgi:hypothetical protein